MIKKINLLLVLLSFIKTSSFHSKKFVHENTVYDDCRTTGRYKFEPGYFKIKALWQREDDKYPLYEVGSIDFVKNQPYLVSLNVHENFRNSGIALSLMYYMFQFYKKNYPNADYVNFESLPKAKSLYLKYGAEQREKPVENETIFSNRSTELIIENRDSLMKWNIDTALEKIGSYLDNLHK